MDATRRGEIYRLHAEICRALADPKRLLLLEELRTGERSVGQLAAALGLAQALTSQHLAVLRERGLVTARREGTVVYYAIADSDILAAVDLLRGVLARRLARQAVTHDALQSALGGAPI